MNEYKSDRVGTFYKNGKKIFHGEVIMDLHALEKQVEEYRKALEDVKEALDTYGTHTMDCNWHLLEETGSGLFRRGKCDCGFEALAEGKESE